jgi:tryptophan-rich sensory protein
MTAPERRPPLREIAGFMAFIALCISVSALGGAVTASSVGNWYQTLEKPPFNPPDWLFAPVWITLFLMMAVAAWLVWRRVGLLSRPIAAFTVQLCLNLLWSVLFFGLRSPGLALLEIFVLLVAIAYTARLFLQLEPWAGVLLLPYLLWVGFAAVLNAAIWYMN